LRLRSASVVSPVGVAHAEVDDVGIVVLSPDFFKKKWPQSELDGLSQLETAERKMILPIWKDVGEAEVKHFSPIFAGRVAVSASEGIERVVEQIRRAVGFVDQFKDISASGWEDALLALEGDISHNRKVKQYSGTSDAVREVTKVARDIMAEARVKAEEMCARLSTLKLEIVDAEGVRGSVVFTLRGPNRLDLHLCFETSSVNSLTDAELSVGIMRRRDRWREGAECGPLEEFQFKPAFDREMKVYWTGKDLTFTDRTNLLDFAFGRFVRALANDK
jgi:hypothetical protein